MTDNQTKQAIANAFGLLSDNDHSVRLEAVKQLGIIGVAHPKIIERLIAIVLNDPSDDVRGAAIHSLDILQPTPVDDGPQIVPITPKSDKPQTVPAQTQLFESSLSNEKTMIELLRKQNEILENLRVLIYQSAEAKTEKEYRLRTRIVDIDMSISSIANLMFKWFIASIPVGIVIGFIIFFLSSCLALLGR